MDETLPFARREIVIGGRVWLVDAVDDQDALLRVAETSAQFPFGLMLWESAVALAEELHARGPHLVGKTVLELGAGLGLSGVVAAHLGAGVTQTDHDDAALQACQRTADINGVTGIARKPGNWHSWQDDTRYDFILGADIAYDGEDHAALLAVFERCITPGGVILLADPNREKQAVFVTRAVAAGFFVIRTVRVVPDLKAASPGAQLQIAILELRFA
jgi:methyltransferase-like protein 23